MAGNILQVRISNGCRSSDMGMANLAAIAEILSKWSHLANSNGYKEVIDT